jgi:hypothetical protein
MAEPILDLGCGEHARLVRYLRRHDLQAIGLDRVATEEEHALTADWFAVEQPPRTWGTIISHLAFSRQFLHHHLRGGPDAEAYARLYMQLLRSLRPGGSLVYTPGLPFIEALLPAERYRVARRRIALPHTRAAAVPGLPLYACAVTRAE